VGIEIGGVSTVLVIAGVAIVKLRGQDDTTAEGGGVILRTKCAVRGMDLFFQYAMEDRF